VGGRRPAGSAAHLEARATASHFNNGRGSAGWDAAGQGQCLNFTQVCQAFGGKSAAGRQKSGRRVGDLWALTCLYSASTGTRPPPRSPALPVHQGSEFLEITRLCSCSVRSVSWSAGVHKAMQASADRSGAAASRQSEQVRTPLPQQQRCDNSRPSQFTEPAARSRSTCYQRCSPPPCPAPHTPSQAHRQMSTQT